jgi:excisionase family DNA binding protein
MRCPPPADRLLTPQQAALRLRIGVRTLTLWADAGRIDCIRIGLGHHRRYRLSAVLAALGEDNDTGQAPS